MANILCIETSDKICSVSFLENEMIIKTIFGTEINDHASQLAVIINKIFKETNKRISELHAVALSSGPGSYTGLRIGTSIAKGICYAAEIPLISINTLQAIADGFIQKHTLNDFLVCPLIDARRMEAYYSVFNSEMQIVSNQNSIILTQDSFQELLSENKIYFIGTGAKKFQTIAQTKNAFFFPDYQVSSSDLASLALLAFRQKVFSDLSSFEPNYIKSFYTTHSAHKNQ